LTFKEIPIDKIIVKKNIRTDPDGELGGLMETIEKYELLQPVLVIPKDGSYELVSGHRRLEAMKARNEATVPCIIRNDLSKKALPFIKLVENVQRKQLSSYELVQIFEEMKKSIPGLTQHAIAMMVGKSDTWVQSKYKIEKIIAELIEKDIPMEAIDELNDADLMKLARVKNKKERKKIAKRIADGENPDLLIQEADSYKKPERRISHSKYDIRKFGFKILTSGDHNLLVICKNKSIRNEIADFLIDSQIKKLNELEHEKINTLEKWRSYSKIARELVLALSRSDFLKLPKSKQFYANRRDLLCWAAEEIDEVLKKEEENGASD